MYFDALNLNQVSGLLYHVSFSSLKIDVARQKLRVMEQLEPIQILQRKYIRCLALPLSTLFVFSSAEEEDDKAIPTPESHFARKNIWAYGGLFPRYPLSELLHRPQFIPYRRKIRENLNFWLSLLSNNLKPEISAWKYIEVRTRPSAEYETFVSMCNL